MPISRQDVEQLNQSVADLQSKIKDAKGSNFEEKFNSLQSEVKEQVAQIKDVMTGLDAKVQKELAKDSANEKINLEIEELAKSFTGKEEILAQRIKDLELTIARSVNSKKEDYKDSAEYKALNEYVIKGSLLEDSHKKYLRTDNGQDGGYLVPVELYSQILEEVEELDPIRAVSRVFTSQVKTLDVPIRTSLPVATYEGEGESVGDSNSQYKVEQLTAYAQHINTPITWDMIKFGAYDMIQQASKDASMAFAIGEGNGFLNGTGVKQPAGILKNATIIADATQTSASATLSLVDVIKLAGKLKTGYLNGARYFMNQQSLFSLRSETDSNGNFLWRVGGEGMPNEIAGIPYIICPSMPNVASNALACGIGNFFYGYYILDAAGISLIRDDFSQKVKRIVELSWFRYNTGAVGIPEAFKLLKVKA